MNNAIFPFLTIPEELINCSEWEVSLSTGSTFFDPAFIEDWDNGTDLTLTRAIQIDLDGALSAIQCEPGRGSLELIVNVGTGAGALPEEKWIAYRQPLVEETGPIYIEIQETGSRHADILHIESAIILGSEAAETNSPIAPRYRGSVLWHEKKRIRIEGDASRFPVSETNLSDLLGNEWRDALWYLDVDWRDPSAEFDTAVRLHINSLKKEFALRFRRGESDALQTVMADVMVQIASGYLSSSDEWDGFVLDTETNTTLEGVATHWLTTVFGSVGSARQFYNNSRDKFHSFLNALAAPTEEDQ